MNRRRSFRFSLLITTKTCRFSQLKISFRPIDVRTETRKQESVESGTAKGKADGYIKKSHDDSVGIGDNARNVMLITVSFQLTGCAA